MKTTLTLAVLFITTLSFGQIGFENYMLDIIERAAYKKTPNSIKGLMKRESYTLNETTTKNGYLLNDYSKSYGPSVSILFDDASKDLLMVVTGDAPIDFYPCERELKEKGFKIIANNPVKNDSGVMVDVNTWEKPGYPYHYVTNHDKFIIFLATKKSDHY